VPEAGDREALGDALQQSEHDRLESRDRYAAAGISIEPAA